MTDPVHGVHSAIWLGAVIRFRARASCLHCEVEDATSSRRRNVWGNDCTCILPAL
jgi:hypothetical protein